MKKLLFLAGTALVLASCADEPATEDTTLAQDSSAEVAPPTDTTSIPASGQEYADAASASDLFEIESAQMALDRSQDSQIREFAEMLVADHQKSTAALREAAQSAEPGVTVDPALSPAQQSDMDALEATDDAQFDQAFLDAQVRAHKTALSMLQGYAEEGEVESLAQHASQTAGPVEQHLERARELQTAGM